MIHKKNRQKYLQNLKLKGNCYFDNTKTNKTEYLSVHPTSFKRILRRLIFVIKTQPNIQEFLLPAGFWPIDRQTDVFI